MRLLSRYRLHIVIGGLFVVTATLWQLVLALPDARTLRVRFLDVGQGDSFLIQAPNGNTIVIDGGPDAKVLQGVGRALGFFNRSVDLVISTHPDRDHIAGLTEVLGRYTVVNVLTTGVRRENTTFRLWEERLRQKHAAVTVAKRGLWAEVSPGVVLLILHPEKNLGGTTLDKTNDTGIVAKLVYGRASYLFTADIERPVEDLLIHEGLNLRADVLKVAHHGSKTSSSEEFLEAVNPREAVISVGLNNAYGHPHREVVERLNGDHIRIFRTDLQGEIEVASDGQNITVR